MTELRTLPVIVQISVAVTALHFVLSVISLAAGEAVRAAMAVAFFVSFLAGAAIYLMAFFMAVARSQNDDVSIAGVFLLGDGSVERPHRRALFGCVGVQVAVALVVAIAQPFTLVTFSLLTPLLGMALAALFGARHGTFGPKPTTRRSA